jgi:hypothetical protein
MLKLSRVVITVSAVLALAAAAGCSTTEDASAEASQDLTASAAPIARFAPYITTLKTALESGQPMEQIAQSLLASGRPAAFGLQALCRVYEEMDPKFATLRNDFKGLEDGIGDYDKWDSIYQAAVAEKKDQPTLDRLKKQRDDAQAAFEAMLTAKKWLTGAGVVSHISEVETFVHDYRWKARKADRTIVLTHLLEEVGNIQSTKYDMTILENGNGLHELRRDIRWVLFEMLGLNGMVVNETQNACPAPGYSSLTDAGKFNLKSTTTEPKPCEISVCLLAAASKAVSAIGDVKDEAEQEVVINGDPDVVPVALQPKAQALYDDLLKNDLFGEYVTQLNACKAAL